MKKIKRIAYFDCSCGVSGDMALGALLDAGLHREDLLGVIAGLNIGRVEVKVSKTTRRGIGGTRAEVVPAKKETRPRHLDDILRILEKGGLGKSVRKKSAAVFKTLARAEARVHRMPLKKVHFHEVGALDTIVDVVGTVAGLEMLGVEEVFCSPLSLGSGWVDCAHGRLPLPAPATVEILKGVPVRHADEGREMTTPTGAALMVTLSREFGTMPPVRLTQVGSGAGNGDSDDATARPNLLRVFIGEAEVGKSRGEEIAVLTANVDDITPEVCAWAIERLLAAGALDAWAEPIAMKKDRPAWAVSAMCSPDAIAAVEEVFFRETGTLGVRVRIERRRVLERKIVRVRTRWGAVRVKVALDRDMRPGASPEFEDCRAIAEKKGVALRRVYDAAIAAFARKK